MKTEHGKHGDPRHHAYDIDKLKDQVSKLTQERDMWRSRCSRVSSAYNAILDVVNNPQILG